MCTNFNVNYILVGNMPRPQTPEFNIIRKYDIPLHLSDPVWPPDMILVSIMGKIPDVRRKSKGFDLVFQDLYLLGVYCPVFGKIRGWKTKQGKKSDFSDTQQVRTTRCTLLFFWGGSKVNYNIAGNPASCEDSPSGERPQDVVALDNVYNGQFNLARMRYWAIMSRFSLVELYSRSL